MRPILDSLELVAVAARAGRVRDDTRDGAAIASIVSRAPGPRGDCYELERVEEGPHSAIMWKDQNAGGAPADGRYANAPPAARRES